ncbi:unnamed protein product [Notodromas monacha]|uniref:Uncharacterized protein n=1 Tax=Notodromas monacha TaxID=399045 RepID=A0A7R9BDD0_9CRUS|nr:unnamed protein product [Notodromas monacha]CAG0913315.1 unnamed protein product [Notodromas monacha]
MGNGVWGRVRAMYDARLGAGPADGSNARIAIAVRIIAACYRATVSLRLDATRHRYAVSPETAGATHLALDECGTPVVDRNFDGRIVASPKSCDTSPSTLDMSEGLVRLDEGVLEQGRAWEAAFQGNPYVSPPDDSELSQ